MIFMPQYLDLLVKAMGVSDVFSQHAIDFGTAMGMIKLSYNVERDRRAITPRMNELCGAYARQCASEMSMDPSPCFELYA